MGNNAQIYPEKFIWPRAATLLLLAELANRKSELMQPHKKRILFGQIAAVLHKHKYKVSWESCERKWRGLQATYKKISDKLSNTGNSAIRWEFFEKVSRIIENDPAYKPPLIVSVGIENATTSTVQGRDRRISGVNNFGAPVNSDILETPSSSVRRRMTRESPGNNVDSTSVNELTSQLKEVTATMNTFNRIQEERNLVLDRIASALEKLTEN